MPRVRSLAYDSSNKAVSEQESELRMIKTRMTLLEREVAMLNTSEGAAQIQEDAGAVNRDARWHCSKCGYLLGFYDVGDDVLRTRYKEHIVYVRVGDGGFVQVVCRGCSQVNTQGYVTPDEVETQVG